MSELLFQNLSTVQSSLQPKPNTIASTTTIAPSSFITFVSGTIDIATVTPPIDGQHHLVFIFTNAAPGNFLTTGNLIGTTTIVQNVPVLAYYNPNDATYYMGNLSA